MINDMKKQYNKPAICTFNIDMRPLMTLSENNPQTQVNHTEYNSEFSARGGWFDEDEEY